MSSWTEIILSCVACKWTHIWHSSSCWWNHNVEGNRNSIQSRSEKMLRHSRGHGHDDGFYCSIWRIYWSSLQTSSVNNLSNLSWNVLSITIHSQSIPENELLLTTLLKVKVVGFCQMLAGQCLSFKEPKLWKYPTYCCQVNRSFISYTSSV